MRSYFSPHTKRSAAPLWVLATFLSIFGSLTTPAMADEAEGGFLQLETVVVDLRPGDAEVRGPSQAAFVEGLGVHGELHLTGDEELQSILGGRPYSAALARGKDTLLSLIHISEPTRLWSGSRMPSCA